MIMATIDGSIVIIAMPAIFRGINLNPLTPGNVTYLLWMIMGYRLVQAVLVVTVGRLGDMFGRVRMYNAGFAVFTVASILLSFDPLDGGGGAWWLHDDVLFFVNWDDQCLYRFDAESDVRPHRLTAPGQSAGTARYADGRVTPDHRWIVCVREQHSGESGPVNELVALLVGEHGRQPGAPDFVPRHEFAYRTERYGTAGEAT